jgi:hypothetical protein
MRLTLRLLLKAAPVDELQLTRLELRLTYPVSVEADF